MKNQVIDIESRPLQELTLKEVLPYFRSIISEEVKILANPVPLKLSGIDNEITEKILLDPARYTFGMVGLAEVLHCSVKTAYNYRSTGEYDPAIIKFGVSDWSKVQPLLNNSKYTLVLAGDVDNIDQEEFAQTVEFIWSVPKPKIQNDILAKLDNDIKVVQEFCKLWESSPTTYDYKKIFEEYVCRLQTIPPSKKRVSLKKDCSKIGQAVEQEQQTAINTQEHSEAETDIHKYRYASTLEYLMVKAGNDETAKLRIREKDAFIRAFCQLNDFDKYFQDVKDACEHPEVTYKASNALGLIEKYVRIKGVIIR